MKNTPLVRLTDNGLFCETGGFYIDPSRGVDKALISHAHSDHACSGSRSYLTVKQGELLLKQRLGYHINLQTVNYAEQISLNGVRVSFHPAGHILGSSQIRIEYNGEVWVISGDYKIEKDLTCDTYEQLSCNTFITESTFGLPIFNWSSQNEIFDNINFWWRNNKDSGITSVIYGYALGKAQRIISGLDPSIGIIYTHNAVEIINQCYRNSGIILPETININEINKENISPGSIFIAPPSADSALWAGIFRNFSSAFASGWMQIRKNRKRSSFDRGFPLSDHADWEGLLQAIKESGADRILITHGYSSQFAKWLCENGYNAGVLETSFKNGRREYSMKNFTSLFLELDETAQPDLKVRALINYFKKVPPEDSAWAVSLLLGRKIKQLVPIKKIRKWSLELAQIPEWLFNECLINAGDLAETISLILPFESSSQSIPLYVWIEQRLLPLKNQQEEIQKEKIVSFWHQLNSVERYIWNKLLIGSFHADVSPRLLIKAISSFCNVKEQYISQRLTGDWIPTPGFFNYLCNPVVSDITFNLPYPFNPEVLLDRKVEDLGDISQWLVESKWNGIRSQIIKRENKVFIWSLDEDLLNDSFPELIELGSLLPDGTVIDGVIIPFKNNTPLPSEELRKRIAKRYPVKKIISYIPASFVAFDLLEFKKEDLRIQSLSYRRTLLIKLINDINHKSAILSEIVKYNSWNDLKITKSETGKKSVNGLMLKRLDSQYVIRSQKIIPSVQSGKLTANWYHWKNDPLTINAILLYARLEQGSTSSLFKEYTFALWHDGKLVSFAKTSSGLSDEEIIQVDSFIRSHTLEKFGPVRTVKPELVFELQFDGVQKSSRHKSGIILLAPRIAHWQHEKKIEDADSLASLTTLLNNSSNLL